MGRLVVLILLVVAASWLLRRATGDAPVRRRRAQPEGSLARCARCGLHFPRNEARTAGGQLYCSEEHARLGAGKS